MMIKLDIAAIALSILCLVASLGFGAPVWGNIVGVGTGLLGLVLLGRARKDGGS